MSEIMVRERFLRSGKKVYEYSFEMASVDGKRKRKSKSGFASKRDARIAGRKALSEYENVGQVMVDRDISYADFLDLWMENDCKLTCKESTLYGYEKKIRLYLKPELGGYRVSSIDKKILQTFITDLYNDGFSINTIISIKGLLTKSFNYALENHYIMTSPANKLVIPQNMQPDKPTRRKEHIYLRKIIYVFLTIFLYLLKCPQSLILSALRAFCLCGKPHISRLIFLYFPCQSWLKSW